MLGTVNKKQINLTLSKSFVISPGRQTLQAQSTLVNKSSASPGMGCQRGQVAIPCLPEPLWQSRRQPTLRLDWRGESRQWHVSGPISIPWHFPVCQENWGCPVNKVPLRRREKGELNVKCKNGIVRWSGHQVRILMQIYSLDQAEEGNDKRMNNWDVWTGNWKYSGF